MSRPGLEGMACRISVASAQDVPLLRYCTCTSIEGQGPGSDAFAASQHISLACYGILLPDGGANRLVLRVISAMICVPPWCDRDDHPKAPHRQVNNLARRHDRITADRGTAAFIFFDAAGTVEDSTENTAAGAGSVDSPVGGRTGDLQILRL